MPVILVAAVASLLTACAVWLTWREGWTLYYGDAESHLNIARRVIDSRTPGYQQLGTAWLPLLHVLLLPLVRNDVLWQTGLAGAIPPAICFVLGVTFFFAAVRRIFASGLAGAVAAALCALNPNALYLASIPMTEAVFFASLAALLYFTVRFRETQSLGSTAGAGIAAFAGTLTRYDAWFLIPFVALYFLFATRQRRFKTAFVFGAMAAVGPLLWLAYNAWVFDNILEFYSGPASAKAIQRGLPYPGFGDWKTALIYFGWAARACAGAPLFFVGAAGVLAALWKRALWPLLMLALPGAFYVWSLHSSGTPIFLPNLWPHGYYNTRYGLAVLPLAAFCCAAIVAIVPRATHSAPAQILAGLAVIAIATSPWLLNPHPAAWITWKESQHNSVARRAWTHKAADFLRARYHPGDGIFTSFGDYTGVLREAGIPLRATLTGDNGLAWQSATLRPDLCLWEQWALVQGGDPVQTAINRARRRGPNYELVRQIIVKGAPVIEIYERRSAPSNLSLPSHDDSISQSPRREE
ncbi:MAG: glycosyltransferase family 39 protein [Acidobacteriia bacterium]|nr:glycosyltransferase family 39 protein [Terriglobia bacterium]